MAFGMTQDLRNRANGALDQVQNNVNAFQSMGPAPTQWGGGGGNTQPSFSNAGPSGFAPTTGQPIMSQPPQQQMQMGQAPSGQQTGGYGPSFAAPSNPNNLNREQYRDSWMSSGVQNMDQMRDWVARNGGTILSDNGTFRTPQGETYDGLIGARTGHGTPGWTPVGDPGGMGNVGPSSMGNLNVPPMYGGNTGFSGGAISGTPFMNGIAPNTSPLGGGQGQTYPWMNQNRNSYYDSRISNPALFNNNTLASADVSSLINKSRKMFGGK